MKRITTLLFLLLFTIPLSAGQKQKEDSHWTHKGVTGLNMSQASFSNWAAGGETSVAFDALFNYELKYKLDRHLWINRLELAYGINNTKSGTSKTNDKIFLSSNYGYKLTKNLYLGALATFNTQFAKGYDYDKPNNPYISRFMAPGYLTIGVGIMWMPKEWLTVSYSPVAWRGTFVQDNYLSSIGSFGVDPGKRFLNQFGSDLIVEAKLSLFNNLSLYSRLELFSNYLKKPQNIIVQWDNMLSLRITKWISANLTFNMLYDDNIKFPVSEEPNAARKARLQIKEVLGIGFQVIF